MAYCLIYCSQVVPNFEHAEVARVLHSSRRWNRRNDVTGCLYFDGTSFIQALDGTSHDVNETFQRLSRDQRHHSITLLRFGPASRRTSLHYMAYVEPGDATELLSSDFRTPGGHFVPELWSPTKADEFMRIASRFAYTA